MAREVLERDTSITSSAPPLTPTPMDATTASNVANATFSSKVPIQTDDASDTLLMHCCAALTAVGNRALCPKELAELCMKRGWTCSGSQPFAIISSAIRAHLRRRGITTSNASNGLPPAPGKAAPLFTSYELTGPVAPEDVEAIGIVKAEKPAIKRGTLWYLSVHGTGFASPFAPNRDPLAHLKHLTHAIPPPPATSGVAHATPPSPERMPTRRGSKPSFTYQAAIAAEMEEIDEMGRGKRKRRASGISGGEWESIALPSTSVASAVPGTSTLTRIVEEPAIGSTWTARPVATSSSVVKLKLRLPAPSDPARAKPASAISSLIADCIPPPSSDDETADELEEADFARRKRLRFRTGEAMPTSASAYRNPRPAFSASTSVIGDDDSASDDDDDARSVHDDFAEAMLRAADFDFEFDHAFSVAPLQSGLAELGHLAIDSATNVSTPATTPRYIDEQPVKELGDASETMLEDGGEDRAEEGDDDAASAASEEEVNAELMRGRERRRAASAGALDAPPSLNINATLCPARPASQRGRSRSFEGIVLPVRAASEGPSSDSSEKETLSSPALPLPALSVVAATEGFAPAALHLVAPPMQDSEPPCQTPYGMPDELEYEYSLQLAELSASASPLAHSSLSPRSPEYQMAEEGDDIDPELLGRRHLSSGSASPYPMAGSGIEEDALSEGATDSGVFHRGFGDAMLTSMDLDVPEAVGLDILDGEFPDADVAPLSSLAPPAFGSAASFFTSFLGSASVPVSVVGIRRDSETSSYDSEAPANEGEAASESESEEEAPPARSTRSSARAQRAARRQRATPATRKRSGRRASATSA